MIKVAKAPLESKILGEAAKKRVREKFDIVMQLKKFEEIFEELVEYDKHDNRERS